MIRLRDVTVVFLVLGCGCRGDTDDERTAPPARAGEPATAAAAASRHTVADFQLLRYLEGNWRGSGYAGGPFYESYGFLNDTTIDMTAWTDSTMTTARERTRYELRDGVIRTDKGARLVKVDQDGHHFAAASYGWTFRSVAPDRWTARVGPSTTYTMDRIVRP
jgi:hypothetical protein